VEESVKRFSTRPSETRNDESFHVALMESNEEDEASLSRRKRTLDDDESTSIVITNENR
jgi:hypothetical protein